MSSFKNDRHDERASQSGSEDGNYPLYGDAHKPIEAEEDDGNNALTSQTLNADGTPKRPMNAFMIFARRRRPQVSAENQAMRTGEISKILSREWVSMPSSEKQFYLEQAKLLKENFNTRYPDYVYRRRPNNSRKRRRSESGGGRPTDQAVGDGDDGVEFDPSPIDGDEHVDAVLPQSSFTRQPYAMSQTSLPPLDPAKYGTYSRTANHQVGNDPLYRTNGQHDARLTPYGAPDRLTGSMGPLSASSPRMSVGGDNVYSYASPSAQTQSPSSPFGGPDPLVTGWQPRADRPSTTWVSGSQERMAPSMPNQKQSPYPSASSWGSNEHPGASSQPSPPSPNYFPTLNSPFYPNQTPINSFQSTASNSSSSSVSHQNSSYDSLAHLHSNAVSRSFTPRGYEASGISPGSPYPPVSSSLDTPSYSHRSRPLVHAGSPYPPPPPSTHSSVHGNPQSSFWRSD